MAVISQAERALFRILSIDSDVSGIVSNRIAPLALDQEQDLPAIMYEIGSSRPYSTLGGASDLVTLDFDIYCMAEDYGTATDLAERVRQALSGRRGNISVPDPGIGVDPFVSVLGCTHTNDRTDYVSPVDGGRVGVFIRQLSFLFSYRSNETDFPG
jgi:hypothetical protein